MLLISKQQSARKQMASQKHTLLVNEGYLEKSLVDVLQNVLCSSGLHMEPDAASIAGSEAGIASESSHVSCFTAHVHDWHALRILSQSDSAGKNCPSLALRIEVSGS